MWGYGIIDLPFMCTHIGIMLTDQERGGKTDIHREKRWEMKERRTDIKKERKMSGFFLFLLSSSERKGAYWFVFAFQKTCQIRIWQAKRLIGKKYYNCIMKCTCLLLLRQPRLSWGVMKHLKNNRTSHE